MSRRKGLLAATVFSTGLLLFFARDALLLAAGDLLVIQDDLEPTDLIHVVSGPDYRADYGIELYLQGYGRQIFFTGGWCKEIQGVHAERGRQRALVAGVPEAAIAGDDFQVTSTWSEAVRLKAFIEQSPRPIRSVIIVSDPHHMRRARWAYHEVLGDGVKLVMAPVPLERTPYQRRWWADAESRALVREEYEKILYYYARYRFGWGPLQTWLASLDTE